MFLVYQTTFISWPCTNHAVSHFSIYGHPNFPILFCPLSAWLLQESPLLGSPPVTNYSPKRQPSSTVFQSNLRFLQPRHSTYCIIITCSLVSTRLWAITLWKEETGSHKWEWQIWECYPVWEALNIRKWPHKKCLCGRYEGWLMTYTKNLVA